MRDHYRHFAHPVLDELSPQPTTDLFTEMDAIADELRAHPAHIPADNQIAFRQLQKVRLPELTQQEWLDLFALWRDHYHARLATKESERRARLAQLWEEHAALPPQQRAAVTAQIEEVARDRGTQHAGPAAAVGRLGLNHPPGPVRSDGQSRVGAGGKGRPACVLGRPFRFGRFRSLRPSVGLLFQNRNLLTNG